MLRHTLWMAVVGLMLLVSPALAAPCTSDGWQPTFVRDLDREDKPYYVTGGMSFLPLEWVPNGGYVPHACRLVRGPQDLRDQRGFTTCQDYTRVQCGCSRSIPGNRTCAAFLRWKDQGGGAPASVGAIAPSRGATLSVPTSTSAWRQAAQYRGGVHAAQFGLVLQGGPWTNGRLQNGAYDGNRVFSAQGFDFTGGGDAYLKFAVNGGGQYMGFYPRVLEGVSVLHMTTHHSWANSVVVPENAWIFAHVRVEPDGSYRIAVSNGGYDDRGGQVIYRNTGRLANLRTRFDFQFLDNYAGAQASVTINEAVVRTGGGGRAGASPLQPAPGGASRGAGAVCSANSDCASSICLLGICAPR